MKLYKFESLFFRFKRCFFILSGLFWAFVESPTDYIAHQSFSEGGLSFYLHSNSMFYGNIELHKNNLYSTDDLQ